jgi:hypothetical protein
LPADRARPVALLSGFSTYDREKYLELLRKAFEPFRLYFAHCRELSF